MPVCTWVTVSLNTACARERERERESERERVCVREREREREKEREIYPINYSNMTDSFPNASYNLHDEGSESTRCTRCD